MNITAPILRGHRAHSQAARQLDSRPCGSLRRWWWPSRTPEDLHQHRQARDCCLRLLRIAICALRSLLSRYTTCLLMLFLGQRTPPRIPRIPARNIIPLRGRRGRRCPPISPDRVSLSLSLDGDHWVMCVHRAARLDDNYDMMTFIRLLERLQHRVPDTLCITKHQSGWQHGFFQPAAEHYRCLSLIA